VRSSLGPPSRNSSDLSNPLNSSALLPIFPSSKEAVPAMSFPKFFSSSILATGLAVALSGCGGSSSSIAVNPSSAVRHYNGTASVGDFLTISIDSDAHTITYDNVTNGENGVVPYTVNSDGTYAITDPHGNLLAAYELPGFALVIEAANAGPGKDTPALITAIETAPASISSFAGKNFNYMQFRTAAGGIEIGTVSINSHGDITHDGYSPMALIWGNNQYFDGGTFPAANITEDPAGNFFTVTEQDSSHDVVFGTQNGLWAVDTGNGAILGLPKASSKSYDPASAGTYKAIIYSKSNATTNQNNVESGTPAQGVGSVVITSNGGITITDSQNHQLATGALVAVEDASYLYDATANKLNDPCRGLFTVRIATANSRQDLFVTFQGNAVIFGSFQSALPGQNSNPYSYFYGVGLK